MFSGRRITITREGCYYLFVALFISGGAVGGEVNLMLLLSGIMIAPLLLHWRILSVSLQRLDLERRVPAYVHAGDPLRVHLVLHNGRRRVGSWCMVVRDQLRRNSKRRDVGDLASTQVMFPFTSAGNKTTVSYQWMLNRRGEYQFGALRLMTRFPFGLLKGSRKMQGTQLLLVYPRMGALTSKWFQLMEADRVGGQESYHARGNAEGDYYGLRHWQPGDSRRWIHWRTSARLGQLAVKQFEQQRDRDIALVLDLHQAPGAGISEQATVELAVSMAATVIQDLGRRTGIRLVVAACGESMHYWAASSSNLVAAEINRCLATIQGGASETFQQGITRLKEELRPGSQVVVVSTRSRDMMQAIALPAKPLWINCNDPGVNAYFQLPGMLVDSSQADGEVVDQARELSST